MTNKKHKQQPEMFSFYTNFLFFVLIFLYSFVFVLYRSFIQFDIVNFKVITHNRCNKRLPVVLTDMQNVLAQPHSLSVSLKTLLHVLKNKIKMKNSS